MTSQYGNELGKEFDLTSQKKLRSLWKTAHLEVASEFTEAERKGKLRFLTCHTLSIKFNLYLSILGGVFKVAFFQVILVEFFEL